MSVLLSGIQRFCVHDGPGIRTTAFLKGCHLHCPWCSNPESMDFGVEYRVSGEKCIREAHGCMIRGDCPAVRGGSVDCRDYEKCTIGAVSRYGEEMGCEELCERLLRDRSYYGKDGGVTFSGGEALLQARELEPLMRALAEEGISVCVETSLFAPAGNVKILLPYIGCFYIDVKILDDARCEAALGGDLNAYFENLGYVMGHRGNSLVTMRMPLARGYTFTMENLERARWLLREYSPDACEIFSVHNLGRPKYEAMGRVYEDFPAVSEDELREAADYLGSSGVDIRVMRP